MDLLGYLVDIFTQNGYLAVLVALLICSLGVPLPEDITLVAGGIIAGLGYANVHLMTVLAIGGVLGGDLIMFSLGYLFGDRVRRWWWVAHLLTPERYALVQEKFDEHGNKVLFSARFLPGMRAAIYVTAGLSRRVSVWRFLLLDGAAALLSVPAWVYLGYIGANNKEWLLTWLHRGQLGVWVLLSVVLLVVGIYWWRRRKRRQAAANK